MANEERKKEDLYIKDKRKSKNFFVTSSAAMNNNKERTKNTISSSVFTKMKADFDSGDFLLDEHLISQNGSILYMMQQIQEDLEDVYNEVSASAFEASFFPFATIDSGSFGLISSSLIPGIDNKYDVGSRGKEWSYLYVDGTAYIDALDLNGTNITTTLNAKAVKTEISGAFTSLSASIATDIGNAGGGTVDTALKNGSTNAVTNNAVYDGLALKLNLAGGQMTGPMAKTFRVLTAGSTAPNVNTGDLYITANPKKPVSITTFGKGGEGQQITILFQDNNTTLVHNTKTMLLAGGKNVNLQTNDTIQLVFYKDKWYEVSRSDNS